MRYIDIVRSVVRNAQEKEIPALTWDEQKHHINAIRQKIEDIEIVVRCKDCKWYQGVHGVQGHAPCEWFNKQVLWNDFCSNGKPYKGGDDE